VTTPFWSSIIVSQDRGNRTTRDAECQGTFEGLYMGFLLQGGPENFPRISPCSSSKPLFEWVQLLWFRFPKTSDKPRVRHMITMPCVIWGTGTEKEGIYQFVEWRIMIRIFSLSLSEWSSCRKHIRNHLGWPWKRTMWTSRAKWPQLVGTNCLAKGYLSHSINKEVLSFPTDKWRPLLWPGADQG